MTRIVGIGGGAGPPRRVARSAGGFALPGAGDAAATGASRAPEAASALLGLQESPGERGTPAERARRRAALVLEELRGLQLDLLRGSNDEGRLARLAILAQTGGAVAEPALRAAIAELGLRVRVELARRRVAVASDG